MRVGSSLFVAALYHPPRPVCSTADLLSYVENCVAELTHDYPLADIILAGDLLNQLRDNDIVERTGFTQIVCRPTRSVSLLNHVSVFNPQLYSTVRVVSSLVKSDHKAVLAISSGAAVSIRKTRQKRVYRPKTPSQNASLLHHLASVDVRTRSNPAELAQTPDPQASYDSLYSYTLGLLEEFYPERTITVTSRDPQYITASIKAKLRRKNRMMRAGRVEEAGALAWQIGRDITRRSKRQLAKINSKPDTKELWRTVRQLTGHEREPAVDPHITADSLNRHYANVSTDPSYEHPLQKHTAAQQTTTRDCVTDYKVFKMLDTLRPTATRLDRLPEDPVTTAGFSDSQRRSSTVQSPT